LDKDETIVAHLIRGIDAYIKLSHGWPIFGSPLKLISIKGSDILKKSSSFLCEVEVRQFQCVDYKKFQTLFFLVLYGCVKKVLMWYQVFTSNCLT